MTTINAKDLLDRLKDHPEILAEMREILNSTTTKPLSVKRPDNTERDKTIAQRVWNGEKRRDIAMEYQISLPRINQIMQMNPNPNPVKVNPNAERDRLILDKAAKKVPRAVIAREHGLSVIRVNQIVGSVPKPKKMTFDERVADAMKKYDGFAEMTMQEECLVMIHKYEPIARKLTQHMAEGMSASLIHAWEFPADCTGGDIKWTPEHYEQVASIMYDFPSGIWKR
jgi:hypothetical protein